MTRRLIYLFLACALCFCACGPALAQDSEAEDDAVYTLLDEAGQVITRRMGRMYPGDEYISASNQLYLVIAKDDGARTATARHMGEEAPLSQSALAALADEKSGGGLICMYSTHSDESYVPGDGDSSLLKNAGIYDVGEAFQKHLEELGAHVVYSKETFHPHDAGAYRRSRSVAGELVDKNPDALIDIHRDGVPADEYETTVDGDKTSKVRLFVGKSNANASENRTFAKQLKATADEEYPGLVKDIYIGKGNYNQDLYPQAILLEFGTHEIDKALAVDSTKYMAQVVYTTLYGENGAASGAKEANAEDARGVGTGMGWLIGLAVAAAIAFALLATGSLRGAGEKLTRTWRETTGGAFSKKKKE